MATVLYITAHPLGSNFSNSLSVGETFINTYREANPNDEIVYLDLYKANIPQIDSDLLSRWGQPPSGPSFEKLSPESKAIAIRMQELLDQFLTADKVVFVNPVWNYAFPAILKSYIDAIVIPRETFKHNGSSVRGLGGFVGTQGGKKVIHIQASGTVLSHGEFEDVEFSHSYLKAVMNFMGIDFVEAIYIEGTEQYKDQAQAIKDRALQQAVELAKKF